MVRKEIWKIQKCSHLILCTSDRLSVGCPVLKTPAPGLNTKNEKCRSMFVEEADTCKVILIYSLSLSLSLSSSEDETDTLPERPTRIQPYQFEPVRQDFERVPEHCVSFEANPMWYSMGFAKSHSLKCSLHKWAWCGTARKSARLNCINLIHFRLTAGWLRRSSCIVIHGVVCELLQFQQHSRPA